MLRTATDDRFSDDTHWLAPASAVAAIIVGAALQVANGVLSPGAVALLVAGLALMLAAVAVRRPGHLSSVDVRLVPLLCATGLAVQIAQLNANTPGTQLRIDALFTALFTTGLAGLALVGGVLVSGPSRRYMPALLGALVMLHFAMGVLVIRHVQGTFIDVDVFQRQSIEALRHGINPYAITFPNIYRDATFYGPGTSVNGQLQFGFPYFPLGLLLALPGTLLTGDHRYTSLLAMELSAVLMACSRPRDFGPVAAVLYLTTPRGFFVLEQSWTEPIVVLGLAAVVYAAGRHQRLVPWLFGAFIALKQYLVFALPAAILLTRARDDRPSVWRLFTVAGLVAAVVTAPFVLWGPAAFLNSVVTLQFRQPFRPESLSLLSWWSSHGHPQPPVAIAFAVAGLISALALWRLPRTAAGFSGAVAVTFLGFFAFNKQAFCNYYFFVVGALCVTLAACAPVPEAASVTRPSPAPVKRLRPGTRAEWWSLGAMLAAAVLPLLWLGDAPFINDEPLLIAAALKANSLGVLAERGLMGTFGFAYGPLPTWVYQLLISTSRDLMVVATLHTALIVFPTAFALWWLSRSLSLWVWFAPVPLLSPYFWFDARALWDNPFLIPLGALAIAGYAAHLSDGSKAGLRVSLAAMVGIPLVHLSGLAFVIPLAVHMVLVRWRSLWSQRGAVTAILATGIVMAWPYWRYLASAEPPAAGAAAGLRGWAFPLLGGRLLSARELEYFFGPGPTEGRALQIAAAVSWLAYGLVWAGIGVAASHALRSRRGAPAAPRAHIASILLATVACQMALDGFAGKFEHPQYYNATWMTFTVLAWFAADWLATTRPALRWMAPATTGLLASALLLTVSTLAFRLHRTAGTREIYGPTLANQLRVARALAPYSPRNPVSTNVIPYRLYPHALETLRELHAERYDSGRSGHLEVRYASPDPSSGAIELIEH